MSFYDQYKPLRNLMSRLNVPNGLVDLWVYSNHLDRGQSLPANYAGDANISVRTTLKQHLYPWEIDTLSRELLLNGSTQGNRSLKTWRDLSAAVNHLRRLDDEAYAYGDKPRDVLLEMHRIPHRQFHWQKRDNPNTYIRALKIFGAPAVDEILVREYGVTARQYILLGLAIAGHLIRSPLYSTNAEQGFSEALNVSPDALRSFFDRVSASREQLKEKIKSSQTYDGDWTYCWNPLEATPLVRIDPTHPERTICPIPHHFARRTTTGIFYDIANKPGFDNAFGKAFEAYIGEVINVTCSDPRFAAHSETKYSVAGNEKHGVDWVLSDNTGNLVIECKTKRLTLHARLLTNLEALESDISIMAEAIVQLYKNIADALRGFTSWSPNGLPIFPMIVTLEDWHILSPSVRNMLVSAVKQKMVEKNVDKTLLAKYPYTIASAVEMEVACQIIAKQGVATFMTLAIAPERNGWSLMPLATSDFPDEMKSISYNLFPDEFESLAPNQPNS